MAGGGDNGMLLGMMAANRASGGSRKKGESSMFNIFPLMIIPVIVYAVVAMFLGGDLSSEVFSVPMVSGQMPLGQGDIMVILAMFFLFVELVKAAGSGTATIINHAVSMMVFVIALGLFLIVPDFGTATFFLIMLMALMDTMAGFIITIVAARRDLAVGGEA
jgi:hypothetical protein